MPCPLNRLALQTFFLPCPILSEQDRLPPQFSRSQPKSVQDSSQWQSCYRPRVQTPSLLPEQLDQKTSQTASSLPPYRGETRGCSAIPQRLRVHYPVFSSLSPGLGA